MSKFIYSGFGDEISPDFDEQLSTMASLGINALELRGEGGRNISVHTAGEVKELKKRLDARGFTVSAVGSPIGKVDIALPFEES